MTDDCGEYQPGKSGLTFQQMKDMYTREGINSIMGANEKSGATFGSREEAMIAKDKAQKINALLAVQREIFETAENSGWHERDRELPEALALIHSEVSEALEAYRDGMEETSNQYRYKRADIDPDPAYEDSEYLFSAIASLPSIHDGEPVLGKPEGVASELADVIIRVLDYSEEKDIDTIRVMLQKMEYNKTRGYRHGGKVI